MKFAKFDKRAAGKYSWLNESPNHGITTIVIRHAFDRCATRYGKLPGLGR
jgi:hypothetical protein